MSDIDNETIVKRRAAEDRLDRRKELEDVAFILGTEQGRRFYWRYMVLCGLFKSSFTGNNTTFFNEGERNIGLRLQADLNESNPNAYLQMLSESKLKEKPNA